MDGTEAAAENGREQAEHYQKDLVLSPLILARKEIDGARARHGENHFFLLVKPSDS